MSLQELPVVLEIKQGNASKQLMQISFENHGLTSYSFECNGVTSLVEFHDNSRKYDKILNNKYVFFNNIRIGNAQK